MRYASGQRGFTLIELLVVVAIIGMLSSVVLASLNSARTNARDARRMQDLTSLTRALELYATDNVGTYPAHSDGTVSGDLSTLVSNNYIPALPADPRYSGGANDYKYCRGSNSGTYDLAAYIEGANQWCRFSHAAVPVTSCLSDISSFCGDVI